MQINELIFACKKKQHFFEKDGTVQNVSQNLAEEVLFKAIIQIILIQIQNKIKKICEAVIQVQIHAMI